MSNICISRRQLLGSALAGLASIPVTVDSARAQAKPAAGKLPPLNANDPAAKALAYAPDATKVDAKANPMYKKGQVCANCLQWDEKTALSQGKCKIFPGKLVAGNGWCKVYVKKTV